MNLYKSLIFLVLVFLIISCSSESTSDLIDDTPISENITYSNDVKTIIDDNCISCHATIPINGAPMPLTTYENVKDAVINRGLITRISLENGQSGLMPAGGPRLLQSKIDIIIQWQNEGFNP